MTVGQSGNVTADINANTVKVDGKVGPQTRRSLNVPLAHRIRQIRINLERWRWLPRTLGTRYLVVNMAGFELYIVDSDDVVLAMPVIVGKAYRVIGEHERAWLVFRATIDSSFINDASLSAILEDQGQFIGGLVAGVFRGADLLEQALPLFRYFGWPAG